MQNLGEEEGSFPAQGRLPGDAYIVAYHRLTAIANRLFSRQQIRKHINDGQDWHHKTEILMGLICGRIEADKGTIKSLKTKNRELRCRLESAMQLNLFEGAWKR